MNWRSIADSLSWFASQNIQQKRGRNTHTKKNSKQEQGASADFSSPGTNDALDLKAISIHPAPPQFTFILILIFYIFLLRPFHSAWMRVEKVDSPYFVKAKAKEAGPKGFLYYCKTLIITAHWHVHTHKAREIPFPSLSFSLRDSFKVYWSGARLLAGGYELRIERRPIHTRWEGACVVASYYTGAFCLFLFSIFTFQ